MELHRIEPGSGGEKRQDPAATVAAPSACCTCVPGLLPFLHLSATGAKPRAACVFRRAVPGNGRDRREVAWAGRRRYRGERRRSPGSPGHEKRYQRKQNVTVLFHTD